MKKINKLINIIKYVKMMINFEKYYIYKKEKKTYKNLKTYKNSEK